MSYNEETSKGYNSKIKSRNRIFNDVEAPCSSALGNIVGLRVLDLGCGSTSILKTGYSTFIMVESAI